MKTVNLRDFAYPHRVITYNPRQVTVVIAGPFKGSARVFTSDGIGRLVVGSRAEVVKQLFGGK